MTLGSMLTLSAKLADLLLGNPSSALLLRLNVGEALPLLLRFGGGIGEALVPLT